MADLLQSDDDRTLFVQRCVRNQGKFYDRFDAVVLLSASAEVILDRIAGRETNDWGKLPAERELILHQLATVEPLLRAGWFTRARRQPTVGRGCGEPDRDRPVRLVLPQYPHQHGPQCTVLLAVDQELGERSALRVAPELSDPVGSFEVGEHEDVEQLGAGSGSEDVQALPEAALKLVGSHCWRLHRRTVAGPRV